MEEIKVTVVEFGDRKHYQMQYRDPITRKKITKSTEVERTGKKKDRDLAVAAAGKWQAELREGRYFAPGRITWKDFRDRYEKEVLAGLAKNTLRRVDGVFNCVESIINPERLRDVTAERISFYQSKLRENGKAESTIDSHLAHLKAAIRWAAEVGLVAVAPKIKRPKRSKQSVVMKGRPITGEEFDRMLAKVESALIGQQSGRKKSVSKRQWTDEAKAKLAASRRAIAAKVAPSWRHYLRGLWLSGLRLEESLELYWDRADKLQVDLSGKRPMLIIPAALEKGNKDRVLPMAPEFAEFLLQTPQDERHGPVFNPRAICQHGERLTAQAVGKTVSAIGKAAGVKVNTTTKCDVDKVKYASAHDLRRSFGERWASRVMPQVLMELMRHESIDTTLRFYVGRNAQKTADVLWAAHQAVSNTSGNSDHFAPNATADSNATSL